MASNVGELKIALSFDKKSLKSSMSGIEAEAKSAGSGFGSAWSVAAGSLIAKGISKITSTAVAPLKNTLSGIFSGGFERSVGIENAQAKLQGLGHSAESVQTIMDSALASVKGTAYGLDSAATIAASAVAAGVKPGEELTRTLSLVADAATISGKDMDSMGAIFNKVAAGGKMTGEELRQLSEGGIPMIQLLADSMGKSEEEIQKLVSAGKIGFAEFQDAIEKGMGGAALQGAKTFEGALANTQAAMRRMGEVIVSPLKDSMTGALNSAIGVFDALVNGNSMAVMSGVQDMVSGVVDGIRAFISQISTMLPDILLAIDTLVTEAVNALPDLLNQGLPLVITTLVSITKTIINNLPKLVMGILTALTNVLPQLMDGIVQTVQMVAQMLPTVLPMLLVAVTQIIMTIIKMFTRPDFLNALLQATIQLFLAIIKAIPQIIIAIVNALPDIITNIIEFLTNPSTIIMLVQAAVQLFMALVQAVPQILGALIGAFGQLFSNLWNVLKTRFTEFAGQFGSTISGVFKNAINGVLQFIENFINGPIDAINGFIGLINDKFGKLGINISTIGRVSLPRLAQGGVTTGATTAIIGEAGQEAVLPLERNTGNWAGLLASTLAEEMGEQGGVGGGIVVEKIEIKIDDKLDAYEIDRILEQRLRRLAI